MKVKITNIIKDSILKQGGWDEADNHAYGFDAISSNSVHLFCYMSIKDGECTIDMGPTSGFERDRFQLDMEYPISNGRVGFYSLNGDHDAPEVGLIYDTIDGGIVLRKEDGTYEHVYKFNIPDNVIQLTSGKYLVNRFGKYMPNLSFINTVPGVKWTNISKLDLNLPKGSYSFVRGRYFVSKKGTNCFSVEANGPHILIRDEWGGAFNDYRGRSLPEDGLYYRRAASNGGGSGYDYAIFQYGWKNALSEEDI